MFKRKFKQFILSNFRGEESNPNLDGAIVLIPCNRNNEDFLIVEPCETEGENYVTVGYLNVHTIWEKPSDKTSCGLIQAIQNYIQLRNEIGDDTYNETFEI